MRCGKLPRNYTEEFGARGVEKSMMIYTENGNFYITINGRGVGHQEAKNGAKRMIRTIRFYNLSI